MLVVVLFGQHVLKNFAGTYFRGWPVLKNFADLSKNAKITKINSRENLIQ